MSHNMSKIRRRKKQQCCSACKVTKVRYKKHGSSRKKWQFCLLVGNASFILNSIGLILMNIEGCCTFCAGKICTLLKLIYKECTNCEVIYLLTLQISDYCQIQQ